MAKQAALQREIQEVPVNPASETPGLAGLAARAVARGQEYLFAIQFADLHWCGELESNASITAEYVMMCQMLGRELEGKRERIACYLLGKQNADGSWGIAQAWDGDVSTTTEVYLSLRILGIQPEHPALGRAEKYILRNGGIEKVRIFTRIFLAMFGLLPWSSIPIIPPEFILLPSQSPVNIYRIASWARGTMVPLFVIFHHRPVFALPNGRSTENGWLDHLWLDPRDKRIPYSSSLFDIVMAHRFSWKTFSGRRTGCFGSMSAPGSARFESSRSVSAPSGSSIDRRRPATGAVFFRR